VAAGGVIRQENWIPPTAQVFRRSRLRYLQSSAVDRRARYLPPFRLYLVMSLLVFALGGFAGSHGPSIRVSLAEDESAISAERPGAGTHAETQADDARKRSSAKLDPVTLRIEHFVMGDLSTIIAFSEKFETLAVHERCDRDSAVPPRAPRRWSPRRCLDGTSPRIRRGYDVKNQ
jgi:hypothetical protein